VVVGGASEVLQRRARPLSRRRLLQLRNERPVPGGRLLKQSPAIRLVLDRQRAWHCRKVFDRRLPAQQVVEFLLRRNLAEAERRGRGVCYVVLEVSNPV